jgi:hypothetical protein
MKQPTKTSKSNSFIIAFPIALSAVLWQGCAGRHSVVAVTGTTIGVEIGQNPQTQMYQAKLGYNRGELAVVPSNRSATEEAGTARGGAKDTTDVIMELKYANIFSFTNSGIYQRLAVGSTAVAQPGAAFMFAKNASGDIDQQTAQAISASIKSIPATPVEITAAKEPLSKAFVQMAADKSDVFNKAAQSEKYLDFRSFLIDQPSPPSNQQIKKIRAELEKDADIKAKLQEIDRR